MNEENKDNSQSQSCCKKETTCSCTYMCKWAFNKALSIVKDPVKAWDEIKGENYTIVDLYKKYVLILAAIPAIGQLIQGIYNGRFPLGLAIVSYVITLASVWLSSFIMKYIAPSFSGSNDQTTCMKLVAFSMTPAWLGGIFYLIPMSVLAYLLSLLCSLYSIYVLWQGITPIVNVPTEKRLVFLIVMVVVSIVISMILGALLFPLILAGTMASSPMMP
ncbi:MAG: YIP1 family protein [SAR324 cluster bacterium]|uniref:YIP1 family protein n=1 Tax=SAR324 cluster bacterium TaxID=2024889 RepID=A0A7X9IIY4_9DELT|nr:YIP1 family protein [SAR324 cluster bacterium]